MLRNHSWRTASLVMALTVIVGLALPALGDHWRPFSGHADEERKGPPMPVDDGIQVTTTGAGWATHLGSFTREATVVIHADGSAEGTVKFTAANGDQLWADIEGASPIPISSTTRVGTYTFTGGTGRFSDASGEADFVGVTTFDSAGNPHIAVDFEGTIQY
ncbi:MAG: hypothetical protein ACRERE_23535 [Candidatus Entotheonellia bacterium]